MRGWRHLMRRYRLQIPRSRRRREQKSNAETQRTRSCAESLGGRIKLGEGLERPHPHKPRVGHQERRDSHFDEIIG
jgi:hypothetical protein